MRRWRRGSPSAAIPYRVVEPELNAGDAATVSGGAILDCQRCTWLRRKALFTGRTRSGCNVLAYAHHADDVAQTTLLNVLYVGATRSLAPVAEYFGGRFRLIRPLIYVPERELAAFALRLPCASAAVPERRRFATGRRLRRCCGCLGRTMRGQVRGI